MDPITAFLVNLVIGIALSFASSLIQQALAPKQREPGVKGTVTLGGNEPLSFLVGRYGSAGHKEYEGTWGSAGNTPNAYHTRVLSFSDLPIRGYRRFFVYGEPVTLGDTPHATYGYPVLEYRKGGKDHLWVRMHDGTQTTADAMLLTAFGSDPDRPWLSDMIGRGIAYCVFTAKVNRELFSGLPEYFVEVDGYDLGDAELNDNPIAMVRKTLAGFSYGGGWVWGLQGLPATRTPAANWDAEIVKCNVAIDLVGGGTEPQFRAGAEIRVDQQPIEVINELLNSCSGRIAEIGGVYKVLVGAPGSPVASFTDEDIIITEGQSFEPFPGLESTFNGVNATYPEPSEKWGMKDAPPLRDADLEGDDDGRRLPADVTFAHVYSGTQVQRLMQAMHRESRRFRNHSMTMLPEWWEYEVLDPVLWTSARNGYVDKVGLITVMDDLPNGNQFIGWKEQEPEDYDWVPETDERSYDTAPLVVARPAPQVMSGWQVFPAVLVDNDGTSRRPSIEVRYDGGLIDVRAVRVQVVLDNSADVVFDGEIPYDEDVSDPAVTLGGVFLPATAYEVRGIYVPFSGRETSWSTWLAVTTPNIRLGAADIQLELEELAQEVAQGLEWATAGVRQALEGYRQLGTLLSEVDLANYHLREQLVREIEVRFEGSVAGYVEVIEAALGEGGAIATALSSLYAAHGGSSSEVNVRWEALATEEGVSARYGVALRTSLEDGGEFRGVTFYGEVPVAPDAPTRWVWDAQQFVFGDFSSGNTFTPILFDGEGNATLQEVRFKRLRSIAQLDDGTPIIDIDGDTGALSITIEDEV